jgi:hypothetical protein
MEDTAMEDTAKEDTTKEDSAKVHACPECEYRSRWASNVTKHVDTVHRGIKDFHCERCQYSASSKRNLEVSE